MIKGTIRWTFILAVLLGIAPFAARVASPLRGPEGSLETTLLTSTDAGRGLASLAVVALVAGAVGSLGSRVFSRDVGLAVAGLSFAWLAWRCGLPEPMVRVRRGADFFGMLAIESVLAGAAGLVVAGCIGLAARERTRGDRAGLYAALVGDGEDRRRVVAAALLAVVASAIGAEVVAYLLAFESIKGQAVAAALGAGIAAGAVSLVLGLGMGVRVGVLPPFVGMLLAAGAAPLIARVKHGGGIVDAALALRLFDAARLAPLDWTTGAFLGIPVGWGWATSLAEPHGKPAQASG